MKKSLDTPFNYLYISSLIFLAIQKILAFIEEEEEEREWMINEN
jgi:hypothetical protein